MDNDSADMVICCASCMGVRARCTIHRTAIEGRGVRPQARSRTGAGTMGQEKNGKGPDVRLGGTCSQFAAPKDGEVDSESATSSDS